MHTISVVIATRNRQALLAQTLESLASQDWPSNRLEVIVADNGSTDATSEVVTNLGRRCGAPLVRYLFVETPGKSAAVNQALAIATGDLVALTDDDVVADPDWLTRLAAAFDQTGAHFVAGRVKPAWESKPPDWLPPSLYGVIAVPENGDERVPITAAQPRVMPIGANMAVRGEVVRRIGGLRADLGKLDGSLRTGEDHEFFLRMLRAGFTGVYEPTAVVHHRVGTERLHRQYFRKWLHQNGRDVARLNHSYTPDGMPSLMGAPRYLWREALLDGVNALRAAARGRRADRFGASGRLIWFAGYLRQAWFGPAPTRADAPANTPLAPQAS